MKSLTSALLIICAYSLCFGQSDKRLKGLDSELNEVLETWKAAGFAVAIVEKDKVLYAKGFGYRDYENKKAADANTLFAIGSCSKSFTASLLGMLENEEKLSLSDNPIQYVSELSFSDPIARQGVTIRDLMSHQTGLPRHDLAWFFFPTDSKDSLIMRIKHHEPFAELREQWYYNNFMYLTQGVIAERITGMSWEDNIKSKIFDPLKMADSRVSSFEAEESSNAAKGYQLNDNKEIEYMEYYRISGMAPAGSIYSSVNDMTKWLKVWINGGKNGEDEFLPASYVRQAISSQAIARSALPNQDRPGLHFANYGYAWGLSSYKGHYRVEHGGNINGFSASTSFFPTDSVGIVVLANQNGSSVPAVVRNIIADRLLKVEKTDWNQDLYKERFGDEEDEEEDDDTSTDEARVSGTRPSHALEQFTGTYSNPGYGSFKIYTENDSLFAQFKRIKLYLDHYHYNVFSLLEVKEDGIDSLSFSGVPKFNFRINDIGEINELSWQIEPAIKDPIAFTRTPDELELSEEELQKYIGTYMLGQMESKVTVKYGTLYWFVPGQKDYELAGIATDVFRITDLQGFKVRFVVDENGVVTGLKSIQPNGTFEAEKKDE
ncbi:serine hydrolase [Ekhidna sp.]|uniref:serine hydrolase n=1 Tax=Ekhidna sp. TaxID=2608089 RepID=UPI003CCC2049